MRALPFLFAALLFALPQLADAQGCTRIAPRNFDLDRYYAPASARSGAALRRALNGIVSGQRHNSYKCLWKVLAEADEAPGRSSHVIGFYTRRPIPKSNRVRGGNTPDHWNREHVWAKSHGFRRQEQHAYTDAHHIVAADQSTNEDRNDRDFREGGRPHGECSGCRITEDTFEPPDIVKGQVARMMFYMAVRYEGGDSSRVPDLELVDGTTSRPSPRFGDLATLKRWHCEFPVSNRERQRNDVVHAWQGNRNPFVDRPRFVEAVWGGRCETGPGSAEPAPAAPANAAEVRALLERIESLEKELAELRRAVEQLQ